MIKAIFHFRIKIKTLRKANGDETAYADTARIHATQPIQVNPLLIGTIVNS
jgi:hypothetical protein